MNKFLTIFAGSGVVMQQPFVSIIVKENEININLRTSGWHVNIVMFPEKVQLVYW